MKRNSLRVQPASLLPPLASALVVLAAASPWMLGFSTSRSAVANAIAFAMAFAPLALMIAVLRPASTVCVAGGVWLAASPWVLGYSSAGAAAWAGDMILGIAFAAMSWRAAPGTARTLTPRSELPSAVEAESAHAARTGGEKASAVRGSRAA